MKPPEDLIVAYNVFTFYVILVGNEKIRFTASRKNRIPSCSPSFAVLQAKVRVEILGPACRPTSLPAGWAGAPSRFSSPRRSSSAGPPAVRCCVHNPLFQRTAQTKMCPNFDCVTYRSVGLGLGTEGQFRFVLEQVLRAGDGRGGGAPARGRAGGRSEASSRGEAAKSLLGQTRLVLRRGPRRSEQLGSGADQHPGELGDPCPGPVLQAAARPAQNLHHKSANMKKGNIDIRKLQVRTTSPPEPYR